MGICNGTCLSFNKDAKLEPEKLKELEDITIHHPVRNFTLSERQLKTPPLLTIVQTKVQSTTRRNTTLEKSLAHPQVLDPDDFALHISIDRSDSPLGKCDSLEACSSPRIEDDQNDRVMISQDYNKIPEDPLEGLNSLINSLAKPNPKEEKVYSHEFKTELIRRAIYNPEPVLGTIIDQDKRI